jgi:hypothetical protein
LLNYFGAGPPLNCAECIYSRDSKFERSYD